MKRKTSAISCLVVNSSSTVADSLPPGIYQVDGIAADFDKQSDLAKVKTSWEGVAAPGDLMFIPCGVPHTVENRGESLALGWFPSGDGMRMQPPSATIPYEGPMQCPNANAVGYDCQTEKKTVKVRVCGVGEGEAGDRQGQWERDGVLHAERL